MPAVVIIGSGFAGLGMAIALKRAGYDDFVILEKADDLGGTWRDNTYPGCACDVQSHVYSYSFAPNPRWTRMFASQPEIWAYLRDCARRYDLYRHIRFGVEFTGAEYDDATGGWRVDTAGGGAWHCRAVVTGLGALHRPAVPDLPGLTRFTGPTWHSAEWNHGYDLTGRRVAVVGTGASAVQIVPAIADRVARLDVYQRTPPWVMPRPDRDIGPVERRLYARVPAVQWLHRAKIYW